MLTKISGKRQIVCWRWSALHRH